MIFSRLFLVYAFCSCLTAWAFPELTTHGYVNCTSCHVSPTGGGVLTEYGRVLSKDLLSTWSREGEEKPFYGAIDFPKSFLVGGDIRTIQTYLNTPQSRSGEFFLMQADLGFAVNIYKWTVAATGGVTGGPDQMPNRFQPLSRIHYVMYQPEETLSVRAGRFLPQYGINEPNHTIVTRQNLGFGEGMESYNVEVAYQGEGGDLFVTGILGRPDDLSLKRETGGALSAGLNFFERNKIGLSTLRLENDLDGRWLGGVWGIFGLTKELFLLSEIDEQWEHTKGVGAKSTQGLASFQKLGYTVHQGVQVYATHQLSYLNFNEVGSRLDAFGPGVDFFPRPHFELRAEFLKERLVAGGADYYDAAWLIGHYYF